MSCEVVGMMGVSQRRPEKLDDGEAANNEDNGVGDDNRFKEGATNAWTVNLSFGSVTTHNNAASANVVKGV